MLDTLSRSALETALEEPSREAIEQGVCDCLVASDPYSFIWIGEPDRQTGEISPRAWAGDGDFLDSVSFSVDRDPPRSVEERALATGTRSIETDLSESGPWVSETKGRGFEAAIAYPLAYEDVPYGVVGVYTERNDAFMPAELDTLDLITTVTAFSIGASNRRRGDVSRQIVELEFDVDDTDLPFVRIASALERNIRLTHTAYRADERDLPPIPSRMHPKNGCPS